MHRDDEEARLRMTPAPGAGAAAAPDSPAFDLRTLDELAIEDEASVRHVGLYRDLKQILGKARYRFRVLPPALRDRWDRALLLNLTFWNPVEEGDVLVDAALPADVVAHVAWHHLATLEVGGAAPGGAHVAEALFLGESIASAFDVYLVGRLLHNAPDSSFLETQVPLMSQTAEEAGLGAGDFEALLEGIADQPEGAFESLRELLFDATCALHRARDAAEGLAALARFDEHPFAPLLHRFELSNWVLHARVFAPGDPTSRAARAVDTALRSAPDSLAWLTTSWVLPRLG